MNKCYEYFLRLLTRKEYSAAELHKKAIEKGFTLEDISPALEQLQNYDYQSDRRLVSGLITAAEGKYGKNVVWRKCYTKGINRDLFEEIWSATTTEVESPEEQWQELREKVQRRYKINDFQNLDPKTKTKIANFLQYRGLKPWEMLALWQQEDINREP